MYDEIDETIKEDVRTMRNNNIQYNRADTDYFCWIHWVNSMIIEATGWEITPDSITINPEYWFEQLEKELDKENIDEEGIIESFKYTARDMFSDNIQIKFDEDIPVEFKYTHPNVCVDCNFSKDELLYDSEKDEYFCPVCG